MLEGSTYKEKGDVPACGLSFEDFTKEDRLVQVNCRKQFVFKEVYLKQWVNDLKMNVCPISGEQLFGEADKTPTA